LAPFYIHQIVGTNLFILGHFALNDPYYSPYDVTYDVIGNPHYSASYPYVIIDLREARVGARVTAKPRVTLGLHASSPKPNVSACVTRPFHDVCLRHH